jgi:hypothetical protein
MGIIKYGTKGRRYIFQQIRILPLPYLIDGHHDISKYEAYLTKDKLMCYNGSILERGDKR